ncbi:isocitrate dehydrogenase [NADP] [Pyrus ussuriensis x Pyrus communis]|uniref:Isocitrate dehydrogenase [NADP] n=1 Tax=Pyrus ussuriensis x Pyrus communis TaxID=2448454 RepID=A0A5N5GQX0_9ROSA|nr:isocitrate dehydrogenase [NADP] [Pyrus ussuriensis x Pyrus communis]
MKSRSLRKVRTGCSLKVEDEVGHSDDINTGKGLRRSKRVGYFLGAIKDHTKQEERKVLLFLEPILCKNIPRIVPVPKGVSPVALDVYNFKGPGVALSVYNADESIQVFANLSMSLALSKK